MRMTLDQAVYMTSIFGFLFSIAYALVSIHLEKWSGLIWVTPFVVLMVFAFRKSRANLKKSHGSL